MTAVPVIATTLPERPYPGLRPFDDNEWMIFFGRERMIDDVIGRLAESRLVLVHGVSGSGKSSLVRAGVLPKLALQYRRHGAPWLICAMRPSGGPLWNLAAEFARLEGRERDLERVSGIVAQFNARGATLASVAASLEGVRDKSLCILVDQFEELFRYEKETSRDEAELFVALIECAATESGGETGTEAVDLHVIVTMRSEFLGECARFAGFAETINRTQYLVPRMDDDGLLRAVRRPAEMYGGAIDEALAERLIASVRGREDELPLLQHGLMLMWKDATKHAAPGERVSFDGRIVDEAGGLAELLSRHADAVMVEAAPDERRARIVEAVFRTLTDVNAEGSATRRPLAFRSLCAVTGAKPEELRPILDAFRAPGVTFLTPYAPAEIADKTPIDVSHEALIRCWRKIGEKPDGWLQKEMREGLGWRALLFQADNFASDASNYLSDPATEWGERRLKERNEAWAERYGDGWPKVEGLVEASREHWEQDEIEKEERRQAEIETERLSRVAAEIETERLRSRLAAILAAIGALIALALAAYLGWDRLKEDIYLLANVRTLTTAQERGLKPGDAFKECSDCPEMVVVPAGRFTMGSTDGLGHGSEHPAHPVTIPRAFAVEKFSLTFDEWDACAAHGDCNRRIRDSGWGRGRQPAINVTWEEAQTHVQWLSRITAKKYRLLSEAEYEYAARAGTETKYPWGDDINLDGKPMANCNGCGAEWDGKRPAPVGSFPPNRFGLYDMVGNVWEWTEDCWHGNYEGAPADGSPWVSADCDLNVIHGGSWFLKPDFLRSAIRSEYYPFNRVNDLGFRVARTLSP